MKFLNETATKSRERGIILTLHHPLGGDGPFDARPARARIGWQILSANKTGKAERRLNKRGVSDRNVKDYLHLCAAMWYQKGSGGDSEVGSSAAICVTIQGVSPFQDAP